MSTVLISDPYGRICCYCLLNLVPAAHFYHYHIPFLDNEKNRMCCSFWFVCIPGGASGKEPACQCRRCKRHEFNPCLERSPGGGHGNPLRLLQHGRLYIVNLMDRAAWQAIVCRIAKSWTWWKWLSTAQHNIIILITLLMFLFANSSTFVSLGSVLIDWVFSFWLVFSCLFVCSTDCQTLYYLPFWVLDILYSEYCIVWICHFINPFYLWWRFG